MLGSLLGFCISSDGVGGDVGVQQEGMVLAVGVGVGFGDGVFDGVADGADSELDVFVLDG